MKTKPIELTEEEILRMAAVIKLNVLPDIELLLISSRTGGAWRQNKKDLELFTNLLEKLK